MDKRIKRKDQEQGIAMYDPKQHLALVFLSGDTPGVVCHTFAAWTLWCLGYPDQGRRQIDDALTLAKQMADPFSLGFALHGAATFHLLRREVSAVQDHAEAAIRVAQEQGFPQWQANGAIQRGWVLAHQGRAQEGIAQITRGFSAHRATVAAIAGSYFLALLAEAYGMQGEPEAGLTVLTEALTRAETIGERWYASELYRLKGALLLQQSSDNDTEAETCLQHAISIAQSQQAKSWELRAAVSLSRLWQQQGKRQDAYDLLAPVYEWFTEGFDSADLIDAKALLDALSEGAP